MPWTLYNFMIREMLKLLAAAAAVLVLLVSFAAAIKPLTDGILDPASLARFVLLMTPTMLQYALPFAAAFAATLVLARMSADNEVLACSAGGLSYITVLWPVLFLGLVLMLGLFFLSSSIAPACNEKAASILQKDLIRLMVNSLQKGQAFKSGHYVIYADSAQERDPTDQEVRQSLAAGSRTAPTQVIALHGVAVGKLGDEGKIVREGTARAANLYVYREGTRTILTAYLEESTYFDAVKGDFLYSRQYEPIGLPLENPLRDKPQFLSRARLKELAQDPTGYDKVEQARQDLMQAVARAMLLRQIRQGLAQKGVVELWGTGDEQYTLRGTPGRITPQGLMLSQPQVEIRRAGGVVRQFAAQAATLHSRCEATDPEPLVIIELQQARVVDPRLTGRGAEHASLTLQAVRWNAPLLAGLARLPIGQLEGDAAVYFADDAPVQTALGATRWQINRLMGEIAAQMNIRGAGALTCLLAPALGAVLALRLRGRSALVVFFWAFLATLVVVIITSNGRNVLLSPRMPRLAGVAAVWLGNLGLLALLGWQYGRLRRN